MIYVLLVLLFILFLGLIFRPDTKTTVVEVAPAVDTQPAVAPIKATVYHVRPRLALFIDRVDKQPKLSTYDNFIFGVPANPKNPAAVRRKVSLSKMKRNLFVKRIARERKYGVTRGHKRVYRFDRQDERLFKRQQHDYLFLNIDGDACDIDENEETEQLQKIWG